MSYYFGEKTWEELNEYVKKDALILLPIGELEEHGLHLPVDTDARIAKYLADEIAEEIQDEIPVLVMPVIWSGYTPKKVSQWPGAMCVRPEIFIELIYDVCVSIITMGFKKLAMIDCHGQHHPMLDIVVKRIADEFEKYFVVTSPSKMSAEEYNKIRKSPRGGSSHAGEWETSLLMYISADLVKINKFSSKDLMKYQSDFVSGDAFLGNQKVIWSSWGIQHTTNGGLGDPSNADRNTGQQIVLAIRRNYKRFLQEYYTFKY